MQFIDKATVLVQAGDGGNGCLSFRHEKFVDHGGPDGGDGGNGGNVVFVASRNQNTLASFRFQKELKAQPGEPGGRQRKAGRAGKDLLVPVPVGTLVVKEDGAIVADLTEDGQRAVVAKGGERGFGNAHFISSTRQAPRIAEKGEKGETFTAALELKMIADVGLVGLPNAGKSTLLSVISNARPEIADYPFTTVTPNLGVVDIDKKTSLLFADIPGLIEGAAEGKGLGDEFLRHVERTAVLLHLIDAYQTDVGEAYHTIQNELKAYKVDLATRPQIVALTKIEGLDADIVADQQAAVRAIAPKDTLVLAISAHSKQGLPEVLRAVAVLVQQTRDKAEAARAAEPEAGVPVLRLEDKGEAWRVTREGDVFVIRGRKIERFAARTDFSSEAGLDRLRDILRKMGIIYELKRQGLQPGNAIAIHGADRFEY